MLSVPKSKPNGRGAGSACSQQRGKGSGRGDDRAGRTTSRGRACAEWQSERIGGRQWEEHWQLLALADNQYAGQGSRETASFSPAIWRD